LLEREGIPCDKQRKWLQKIRANLAHLKEISFARETEIQPMQQKENTLCRKAIADFEHELKTYHEGLQTEHEVEKLTNVLTDLDHFDKRMQNLLHIATNFNYPEELENAQKIMCAIRVLLHHGEHHCNRSEEEKKQ